MIYIPNHLIFIAGGSNNKCFIYDIHKNRFLDWADLNDIYLKPPLLNMNNYIYCFSQLTKEKNYFERTNISSKYPKWEKIYPKFNKNVNLLNKKIYFVSKSINNLIIIGAGDNIRQSKIYGYNLNNNEIYILEENCELEELDNKSFDKISRIYNISIPKYFDRVRNIIMLNKKKIEIKKIFFLNSKNINKVKIVDEPEKQKDESCLIIELKSLNNEEIEKLEENKLNVENINKINYNSNRNKNNTIHNEYFSHNKNNLIEEISEDDDEKIDNKEKNKTIQAKINYNKFHISNKINHFTNDKNSKNNYINNEETNKDLQFGENEEFFNNKNVHDKLKMNEIEDNIQLSRIIKKGDEFDTIDKFAVTERSLINQIGSEKKEMNNTEKKNISKRKNKLPIVQQNNIENKSFLLNNVNYIIENDKNNMYYSLNNNKEEEASL